MTPDPRDIRIAQLAGALREKFTGVRQTSESGHVERYCNLCWTTGPLVPDLKHKPDCLLSSSPGDLVAVPRDWLEQAVSGRFSHEWLDQGRALLPKKG